MKRSIIIFMLVVSMLHAIPVLKTGQTQSYAANDDGYYKAGDERNFCRSESGVVTDNTTGYKWQDDYKDNNGNIKKAIWDDAVKYCSSLTLDGGGWRLPSKNELKTTINYFDNIHIEPVFEQVSLSQLYWTNTAIADQNDFPNGVWGIVYANSSVITIPELKSKINLVRCIKENDAENPDFVRSGNIVTDNITGLQWQDTNESSTEYMSLPDAISYCEGLGGDWRLPNINELSSIVDSKKNDPSIDGKFQFTGTEKVYLSSTSNYKDNLNKVHGIEFNDGGHFPFQTAYYQSGEEPIPLIAGYARCVKEKQIDPPGPFLFSYDLENIEHTKENTVSNAFTIRLKNLKDEDSTDDIGLSDICEKYNFVIKDCHGRGATLVDCDDPSFDFTGDKLVLDFTVDKNDSTTPPQAYFENAKVKVCEKDHPEICTTLDHIIAFTVYGTLFDLKKDAYSFKNRSWNEATFKGSAHHPFGDIADMGSVIESYLPENRKKDFWNSVGQKSFDINVDSKGLCHGMAYTCIANFNRKKYSWGIGNNNTKKWKEDINIHETQLEINPKPFYKDQIIHDYTNEDIEALKKIMYYFVSQNFYKNPENENWVGSYPFDTPLSTIEGKQKILDILKSGSVWGMRFKLTEVGYLNGLFLDKQETKHAVVSTQYISYGREDKWYIYDNEHPDDYLWYHVKTNSKLAVSKNINNTIYGYGNIHNSLFSSINIYYKVSKIGARIGNDYLHIYNTPFQQTAQASIKIEDQNYPAYYDYPFVTHNTVSIVGGEFISIIEKNTSTAVIPQVIANTLKYNKAYAQKSSIFKNKLYLPTETIYIVTIKKDPTIPFLKLYVETPDSNGSIELLNYENIETDEAGQVVASFSVGKGNSDKVVKRVGESNYQPNYQESFVMETPSVQSPSLVMLPGLVQLNWINPEHPNFNEVIIIRKENEKPVDRNDGIVVYSGVEETFIDISITANTDYFYAFYSISADAVVSEAEYLFVDTSKFSIYGSVLDGDNSGVSNVSILLKDLNSSEIINVASSDDKGLFSLSNLINGSYKIEFNHPYYIINDNNVTVILENQSKELLKNALGQPALVIEVENSLQIGKPENIRWNGVNVGTDTVNVQIYREGTGTWENIASQVDYAEHHVSWSVASPEEINATIRVSLDSDSNVYVEQNVTIYSDVDNDGYPDSVDAFPNDPNEWVDTDSDGTGDNEDNDDDNDGMSDDYEKNYGLDPLDDSDANEDADGDGYSNLQEHNAGTDPTDPLDHEVSAAVNPAIIMYLLH